MIQIRLKKTKYKSTANF